MCHQTITTGPDRCRCRAVWAEREAIARRLCERLTWTKEEDVTQDAYVVEHEYNQPPVGTGPIPPPPDTPFNSCWRLVRTCQKKFGGRYRGYRIYRLTYSALPSASRLPEYPITAAGRGIIVKGAGRGGGRWEQGRRLHDDSSARRAVVASRGLEGFVYLLQLMVAECADRSDFLTIFYSDKFVN